LVANVRERGPADVVRWMEQGIIAALDPLGFPAIRRQTPPGGPSLVGVWRPDHRKVASIGLRMRGGVRRHGLPLHHDPHPTALDALGFPAIGRQTPPGGPSLVGVWTPDHRKVASIGLRIRGGVSSHGFALNVDPDMTVFDQFVSCGLTDPITSLRVLAEERGE